jgi:hypothetical protein
MNQSPKPEPGPGPGPGSQDKADVEAKAEAKHMPLTADQRLLLRWTLARPPGDLRPLLAWHVPRARALEQALAPPLAKRASAAYAVGDACASLAWHRAWTHADLRLLPETEQKQKQTPIDSATARRLLAEEVPNDAKDPALWLRAAQLCVDAHLPELWPRLYAALPPDLRARPAFRFALFTSRAWDLPK